MPGSPPTNNAEPATSPPPQTRSNSVMPVMRRGGGASSVFRSSSANLRPLTRRPALDPMGGAAPSSTMVFQPLQASHLPAHLGGVEPQDWQTKVGEDLAMPMSTKRERKAQAGLNRLFHEIAGRDRGR